MDCMWISKQEYKKLTNEILGLKASLESAIDNRNLIAELLQRYMNNNESLAEQLEELKVKYTDEVQKNFELAQCMSQTKIKKGV